MGLAQLTSHQKEAIFRSISHWREIFSFAYRRVDRCTAANKKESATRKRVRKGDALFFANVVPAPIPLFPDSVTTKYLQRHAKSSPVARRANSAFSSIANDHALLSQAAWHHSSHQPKAIKHKALAPLAAFPLPLFSDRFSSPPSLQRITK
jgi:hypothetical protein